MQILILPWERGAASQRGQGPWKTKEGNEDLYFIHSEQKKSLLWLCSVVASPSSSGSLPKMISSAYKANWAVSRTAGTPCCHSHTMNNGVMLLTQQ